MFNRWSMLALLASAALVIWAGTAAVAQYGGGGYGYEQAPAGLTSQVKTAQAHATNSARSEALRDARWHLSHVVNCLEGPRGKNYDAQAGNPCQGQGNGILPDLDAAVRAYQMGASTALDAARRADELAVETLKSNDLGQVKTGAGRVADLLGQALKALGQ
ncbi:MAG: hypothetical protein RB150_11150 [Armatimonadota bacterium]|nr:hypothetical protein [Armatimonadota bacterium]MDR7436564.1 hypothetical protein [Armatimonadota bacterium]MDR7473124.1 hypothetical protein [Armatimonadota bacterium]MDR7509189.1 hypothetical protein [Armatimonadota bacterium]MDR7516757.1 hypothetical protein [Armatimonadota bacterium]